MLSAAAVMQRKEEFSFLLFGFITVPVHVNSEKTWTVQTTSLYIGHQCGESEEENGIQDTGQTLKLLTNEL